jgi:polyphosphate kinase
MAKTRKIFSRELSWLSFNERVLQEAADPSVPLLERIKFLGIFSNNLDEFFKVRVATIKRMIDVQEENKTVEGEKPKKLMAEIQKKVILQQQKFENIWEQILEELKEENIFIINEQQLVPSQADYVKEYFDDKVLPALSPVMLHNVETFPLMKDKSIYFAVKLSGVATKPEYALVEIPSSSVSRFLVLPEEHGNQYIILLDDVIRYCLNNVFSIFHYSKIEAYTIKLTRDAELDLDNDLSQSLLEMISKGVSSRKSGQPVRFVYDKDIPSDLFNYVINRLGLDIDDNLIPGGRYHNFKDFMGFPQIGGPHLVNLPAPPVDHQDIKTDESILDLIEKKDILLHYPYQKFSHFINLLREAAIDPLVVSIKVTLYRVAYTSKVVNALINAARNGKEVWVLFELQARFDEKTNIYWTRKLEEAGVNVLFGIKSLKVHGKLLLISKKDNKKLKLYAGISTGNFHEGNAVVYSDITLLTKDKRITTEVFKAFEMFNAFYKNYSFKHLLLAPNFMRKRLIALIDKEIKNARTGKNAYIILKVNNLVDQTMVKKLYQAANEGVKITLIVRGMCSIFTGSESFSKNIEAISIVDKYLEHSRIFIFCNNDKELYFISSADWMTRNLDHRVEVSCPIFDLAIKKEIRKIIDTQLQDNVKARIISDEQNNPYKRTDNSHMVRSQIELYNYYLQKSLSSERVESN